MGKHTSYRSLLSRFPVKRPFLLLLILTLAGCRSRGAIEPIPYAWHPTVPSPNQPAPAHLPAAWQSGGAASGQPREMLPLPAVSTVTLTNLSCEDCLRLAFEKQPRVVSPRASLATAQEGVRAIEKLRIPASLSAQMPYRHKQACLAVAAASAGLDLAEREAAYGVTRTYLTVLFAREQERVAQSAVERLNAIKEAAEKGLEAGARDVTAADVARSVVYLRLAETRRIQAAQGVKRALIALREAIGLGPEVVIDIPAAALPEADAQPNKESVVAAALSRRGELILSLIHI